MSLRTFQCCAQRSELRAEMSVPAAARRQRRGGINFFVRASTFHANGMRGTGSGVRVSPAKKKKKDSYRRQQGGESQYR